MGDRGGRPGRRAVAALVTAVLALAVAGPAAAAPAPAGSPAPTTPGGGPPAGAVPLPPLPPVGLDITDGRPAATLLADAVTLASVGERGGPLAAQLAGLQHDLDRDAVTARREQQAAALADRQAAAASRAAEQAAAQYRSLAGALHQAVLRLYVDGPTVLQLNLRAGQSLAYAADYANTALSPSGVLAKRKLEATERDRQRQAAARARAAADRAAAEASAAAAREQAEVAQLQAELSAVEGASAGLVAADHATLAHQAGAELLAATSLQFTPAQPVPPPLPTTAVALTWAFAELGTPYLWGGTGPDRFDCSGLTQYVWRQAGVALPRVAADQDAWAVPVPLSDLLPGDLVFYGRRDIHHVGLYIGGGLMINAPHTGDVVRVSSIWWSDLAGFGRVHAPGTPVPPHPTPSPVRPVAPAVVPTAGAVPAQTAPPPGWTPTPGSSTPIAVPVVPPAAPSTTTVPPSTSTTSTTTPGDTTTTTAPAGGTTTSTTTVGGPPSTVAAGRD